jgi:hypothetical protein
MTSPPRAADRGRLTAGAIAGLVIRWRRGGSLVRQLLLLALAIWPPALVFVAILINVGVPGWTFGEVLLPLPAAITVAVLHHGLPRSS